MTDSATQDSPSVNSFPNSLTPDVVKTLLDNQAKELELKAIELALQKQQDDHGFEFGKAALDAKIQDRTLQRKHVLSVKKARYTLITILTIIVAAIVFYSLYSNNSQVAMEIIKAAVYLTGGGLGGYGAAKASNSSNSSDSDQQNPE